MVEDTTIKLEAGLNNYRAMSGELQWFNIDGSAWSTNAHGTQVRISLVHSDLLHKRLFFRSY